MKIWIGKYILIQIWNIYWHQILLKVYFWSVQMFIKFHTIFKIFILGRFFPKISEKKCCFLNNIFRKFEIVVCFAPLLQGFDTSTEIHNQRYYKPRCGEWPRSGRTIYIEHHSFLGIEVLPLHNFQPFPWRRVFLAVSSEFENTEMLENLREASALSLFRLYIAFTK